MKEENIHIAKKITEDELMGWCFLILIIAYFLSALLDYIVKKFKEMDKDEKKEYFIKLWLYAYLAEIFFLYVLKVKYPDENSFRILCFISIGLLLTLWVKDIFHNQGTDIKIIHKYFNFLKPITKNQALEKSKERDNKIKLKELMKEFSYKEERMKKLEEEIEFMKSDIETKKGYIHHHNEDRKKLKKQIKELGGF